MPRFDLRQDDETLKPLAPFQMLAVMCCPTDRRRREGMMGNIQATSGMAMPRRKAFSSEEFRREVRLSSLKAAVSGGLLLTRLQLHLNGYPFSLARAMPLVKALLPAWEQQTGGTWPKDPRSRQWPHSRRKMLAAYDEYRSVAHLWAALIHGGQHERADIWPASIETIPVMLSYAEALLEIASRLPSPQRDHRFALTQSEVWSFMIPRKLVLRRTLEALPLNQDQLQILNEPQVCKSLN